jgi:hypothetical protein
MPNDQFSMLNAQNSPTKNVKAKILHEKLMPNDLSTMVETSSHLRPIPSAILAGEVSPRWGLAIGAGIGDLGLAPQAIDDRPVGAGESGRGPVRSRVMSDACWTAAGVRVRRD